VSPGMNTPNLDDLRHEIARQSSPERALGVATYFKTGPGQYGEGDVFVGLMVPQSRKIASQFKNLPLDSAKELLASSVHEERLIALLLLIKAFRSGTPNLKQDVYEFYLANTAQVNNWDLVDLSAPDIVGGYLKDHHRAVLRSLAASSLLWDRRISMISTFRLIDELSQYEDTFAVADILLNDKHDLIQKAVGWMLREVGKRVSQEVEESFLRPRYQSMPRTALRYAIERFPEELRQAYLHGEI
jgi:3-methyladenine DNA glycosylase AlkD